MADSWMESRKRNGLRNLVLVLIAGAAVALLVLQNNFGVIDRIAVRFEKPRTFPISEQSGTGPIVKQTVVQQDALIQKDSVVPPQPKSLPSKPIGRAVKPGSIRQAEPVSNREPSPAATIVQKKQVGGTTATPAPSGLQDVPGAGLTARRRQAPDTIAITGIICRLSGREPAQIVVSLALICTSTQRCNEVLLKRDEVRAVVQKIFSTRILAEIDVAFLRRDIKKQINRLLREDVVTDIEFLDFRPIEMQ